MLPFVSLSTASATGPGASRDLEAVLARHTISISATGSPSGFVVALQGSHDGSTWFSLGTANEATPVATVTTHLVRYVRANWSSVNGGSSPTVTATIASD